MEDIQSQICRNRSEDIWKTFKRLLDHAKKIICLDGFLSNCTISLMVELAKDMSEIALIKSKYTIKRGTL